MELLNNYTDADFGPHFFMVLKAIQSQAEEIANMLSRCGQNLRNQGIDQWDESYPNLATIKNDISQGNCFIYQQEDKVIGCIVLNETQDEEYFQLDWLTSNDEKHLVVHRLGVDPEHQGKGIARLIMDFAEQYAKQNNYKSIRLDTFSQNPRNQKFYLNRGYKEVGIVYLPYKKEFPYHCYELVF